MASVRSALCRALATRVAAGGLTRIATLRPAQLALPSRATLNPVAFAGQRWIRTFVDKKANLSEEERERAQRTLYVDNLSWELTDKDLQDELATFGEVEVFERFKFKKGTARAQYKDASMMESAAEKLNGSMWLRRQLVAEPSKFPAGYSSQPPTDTIFVGGLIPNLTDQELNDLVNQLPGNPQLQIKVIQRTSGSGLVGFATYRSTAEAQKTLDKLRNSDPISVRGREVYFNFATRSASIRPSDGRPGRSFDQQRQNHTRTYQKKARVEEYDQEEVRQEETHQEEAHQEEANQHQEEVRQN